MQSYIKIVGNINLKKYDENGRLIDTLSYPNLVVNTGKQFIASRLAANTSLISHIGLGEGISGVVPSDTGLEIEIDRANLSTTPTVTGTEITYTATFGAANAVGTLSEAGLFNGANTQNSTMVCRTIFPEYEKLSNEAVSISWTLTII